MLKRKVSFNDKVTTRQDGGETCSGVSDAIKSNVLAIERFYGKIKTSEANILIENFWENIQNIKNKYSNSEKEVERNFFSSMPGMLGKERLAEMKKSMKTLEEAGNTDMKAEIYEFYFQVFMKRSFDVINIKKESIANALKLDEILNSERDQAGSKSKLFKVEIVPLDGVDCKDSSEEFSAIVKMDGGVENKSTDIIDENASDIFAKEERISAIEKFYGEINRSAMDKALRGYFQAVMDVKIECSDIDKEAGDYSFNAIVENFGGDPLEAIHHFSDSLEKSISVDAKEKLAGCHEFYKHLLYKLKAAAEKSIENALKFYKIDKETEFFESEVKDDSGCSSDEEIEQEWLDVDAVTVANTLANIGDKYQLGLQGWSAREFANQEFDREIKKSDENKLSKDNLQPLYEIEEDFSHSSEEVEKNTSCSSGEKLGFESIIQATRAKEPVTDKLAELEKYKENFTHEMDKLAHDKEMCILKSRKFLPLVSDGENFSCKSQAFFGPGQNDMVPPLNIDNNAGVSEIVSCRTIPAPPENIDNYSDLASHAISPELSVSWTSRDAGAEYSESEINDVNECVGCGDYVSGQ